MRFIKKLNQNDMTKRLIFLLSCFICCAFLSAQQIDTVRFYADYNKLVDRVNSEYVKVYCEYCMETKRYSQEDSASYVSVIRGQLGGSLSYDSLFTLLDNNNWSATAQNLLCPLEKAKRNVNVNKITLDTLLSLSFSLSTMPQKLHAKFLEAQARLRNEIIKDYSPKKNIFDMIALYIAIGAMFLALIACGLAFFMFFKMQKSTQENRYKEMNRSSNVNTDIDATKEIALDVQNLQQSFYNLKYSVDKLEKEFTKISSNSVNSPVNTSVVTPSSIPQQESQAGSVNLKSKDGGYLEESDGRFDFRGFNIRGNDASFEFCGRADRAIENKDAIFGGVCICEGNSRNAQTVKSLKPGKIRLEGNGNWKVIEKAVVKFE